MAQGIPRMWPEGGGNSSRFEPRRWTSHIAKDQAQKNKYKMPSNTLPSVRADVGDDFLKGGFVRT